MNFGTNLMRQICPRCSRPVTACICHWIAAVTPITDVLILQHPLEVKQAKGSARLLQLCLAGSALHVAEQFDEAALKELLSAQGRTPVLLYPEWHDNQGMKAPTQFDPALLDAPENVRLVIIDGTWRKSRKMLYLNPLLQNLPRLSLADMPASHYRIRKAHRDDQLSTLEAGCYALMQLERNSEKYVPVLNAFDGFIRQQIALSGRVEVGESS